MSQKELLKRHIEEEREKLNLLLSGGGKVEDVYRQSVVVDRLIEQYMDCDAV
ncbi:MAG: Spo0E family sporulation regulatory protein-aspartic acid phosphatase [Candidatus Choladocola sp.]|nr:Spo0E family sporulation regulatory protein-aspartic acid phosphatase [Candidatus Choladocola sp.]